MDRYDSPAHGQKPNKGILPDISKLRRIMMPTAIIGDPHLCIEVVREPLVIIDTPVETQTVIEYPHLPLPAFVSKPDQN